ncbi:hypothetical protein EDD18DRAFT_1114084 [Armillaria luteobubalina]|uniref:F-box domain-containing protein n=1 Tax=Armillaria luteobubalina TaxID=153913 RepID=A0AA39P6S9_9AGAR|nr:hypothetical protein EDD18DRAFT_1114084 [Armillaria luteobubalina]
MPVYTSDLVVSSWMKGNPLKAELYRSLKPLLSQFISDWQALDEKCASKPFSNWDTALSSLFMDFPDEIKMAIINTVPCSDLLSLHPVSRHLWELVTPIMHSHLCFRVPPSGWLAFAEESILLHRWAVTAELLGTIFIDEAWFLVESVSFQSWPMNQYCFFNFLDNAAVTMKDLIVARCSLTCHSLLGMLALGTMLESLEFDHVDNSFVITLPDPTSTEVQNCSGEEPPSGVHSTFEVKLHTGHTTRSFLYPCIQWGWTEMSESLTTLTIHYCDVEYPAFHNGHLPLASLNMLKHIKLVVPVSSICHVLWSTVT